MVALRLFGKAERLHNGTYLIILFQFDKHVNVAHTTHIALRIKRFEQRAFERHKVDVFRFKSGKYPFAFEYLLFVQTKRGTHNAEKFLHGGR